MFLSLKYSFLPRRKIGAQFDSEIFRENCFLGIAKRARKITLQ
tara:strand:+ start:277 stop:405 length:129 start_codon:yes stop_codon:yes gene_type:complete